jgi:hypothetical protein
MLHLISRCTSDTQSKQPGGHSALLLLVLVGYPLLRGVLAPFHGPLFQHGRYVGFLFPLFILLGVIGLRQAIYQLALQGLFPRARRVAAWAPVLVWGIWGVHVVGQQLQYARTYASNIADIETMHVAMGRWLGHNTEENAVIATHDIGAIGYFSGRQVVDTSGLITPGVLKHLKPGRLADTGVLEFLEQVQPDYLVVMPTWYPELVRRKDHFEPIHEIVLETRSIAAGDRLAVFRAKWR